MEIQGGELCPGPVIERLWLAQLQPYRARWKKGDERLPIEQLPPDAGAGASIEHVFPCLVQAPAIQHPKNRYQRPCPLSGKLHGPLVAVQATQFKEIHGGGWKHLVPLARGSALATFRERQTRSPRSTPLRQRPAKRLGTLDPVSIRERSRRSISSSGEK
jgi:hypothetical protein